MNTITTLIKSLSNNILNTFKESERAADVILWKTKSASWTANEVLWKNDWASWYHDHQVQAVTQGLSLEKLYKL